MKRSLLALTLLAALPFAASAADGLSYNYVQGGYTHVNSDVNAKGWAVDGSAAIAPNFHVFGGYNAVKADTIVTPAGSPEATWWANTVNCVCPRAFRDRSKAAIRSRG